MREKRFETGLNIRLHRADRDELERVSERLGLEESEVARRALRLGLRTLNDITLPGSRETNFPEGREL